MTIINRVDSDNTLQRVSGTMNDKVWRPVTKGGLSSNKNQAQSNLVQKAVTTAAAAAPASTTTTLAAGTPLQLTSISAVESPIKSQGRTFSEVSVSFTRNPSDTNFDSVKIWFTGYEGTTDPQLMAQGTTSPITFLVETTGETVTVYGQAVSAAGLTSDLTTAIHTTVVLDGVVSAPPAPTVTQNLLATSEGYQFSFAYEGGLLADVIQSYNIYRYTSNTPSSAVIVKNVPQPSTNSGNYVYQETVPVGTSYYYWVTSVNTVGLESTKTAAQSGLVINGNQPNLNGTDGVNTSGTGQNLVFNGDFSITTTPTGVQSATASAVRVQDNGQPSCNGWTRNFESAGAGEGYIYQYPNANYTGLVGQYSMVIQDGSGGNNYGFGAVCDALPVRPGATYQFSANLSVGLGNGGTVPTNGSWYMRVLWYEIGTTDFSKTSATLLSYNDIVAGSTAGGAQAPNALLVAPATAGYCRIAFYHWLTGTVATGWNLVVSNVRCVETTDPSGIGVLSKGGTPFSWVGAFSYTSTTSSITWSWSSLTLYRSDGTTVSIGSGSQTISGLSSSTTYYFYPYWDEPSASVKWVAGGTGSPAYAQTAATAPLLQSQNLQSQIAMSVGSMSASTPSSGSGGGSGGGGGGGGACFTGNVRIKTPDGLVAFKDLPRGYNFNIIGLNGTQCARLLVHENYSGNFVDIKDGKFVTTGHGMKCGDKFIPASEYFDGHIVHFKGITVYNLHIFTSFEEDRHYILETGDVAHNAHKNL